MMRKILRNILFEISGTWLQKLLSNEGNTQFKIKARGDDIDVLHDTTKEFFVREELDKRLKSKTLASIANKVFVNNLEEEKLKELVKFQQTRKLSEYDCH